MKAQELRIGNLVDLGNRIAKVIDIGHLSCTVVHLEETQDTLEDYERTRGIALTKEWLEKFGFEKLTDSKDGFKTTSYTYTKGISFIVHFDGVRLSTNFWIGNEKHYVHQLQNLFFALTGEELKLI